MTNTLTLKPGTRLRTGGTTYEVTDDAKVPAGIVEVIPQPSRLLKVHCETCGYCARITQRWITRAGTPECPSGHGWMVVVPKAEPKTVEAIAEPPVKRRKAVKVTPIPPPDGENDEDRFEDILDPPEPQPDTPSALAELLDEL